MDKYTHVILMGTLALSFILFVPAVFLQYPSPTHKIIFSVALIFLNGIGTYAFIHKLRAERVSLFMEIPPYSTLAAMSICLLAVSVIGLVMVITKMFV